MPYIAKKKVTHWVVDVPGKGKKVKQRRATKGAPGAYPVATETKSYYLFETGDKVVKKLFTDRAASQTELAKYLVAKERGEAGMTDRFSRHKDARVDELLTRFLAAFKAQPGNPKYQSETGRILTKAVAACCPGGLLKEFTGEAVENYLTALSKPATKSRPAEPVSPNTRKKHHSALSVFSDWLFRQRITRENVIATVPVPRGKVLTPNKPRSLSMDELEPIFRAAVARPLREAQTVRTGDRKGALVAQVRAEVRERLERVGQARRLLYKTAVLTGLRKEELARLVVGDIDFETRPFAVLNLRPEATKNAKAARLLLEAGLAAELRAWTTAQRMRTADHLFQVPDKLNRIFLKDVKAAGVALKTEKGKTMFRSLRKSANVVLRAAGIPVQDRKLFMRHSDIKLTDATYDDTDLSQLSNIMPVLEQVGARL